MSDSASGDKVSTPVTVLDDESRGTKSPGLPGFLQGRNPDFVLVWNDALKSAVTQDAFEKRSIFEYNLEDEGLILEWENSEMEPHLHAVKIWAPLSVLKRYSEVLKVRLPMKLLTAEDNGKCQTSRTSSQHSLLMMKASSSLVVNFGDCWRAFKKSLSLELDPELFPEKCRKLTGLYSRDKEYLFDVDESNMYDIFPISMRSRIVQYILKRTPYKSQEQLERDDFAFGYERLIQKNIYEAGYPLHDGSLNTKGSTRRLLFENWASLSTVLKYQPLDTLREYFGVNIALYFAWLGYYTGMLGFSSIFGIACFVYGMASIDKDPYVNDVCNSTAEILMCPICDHVCPFWQLSEKCSYSKFAHLFDNDFTVVFALLMTVWTAFFLEFWKRYSARITFRWDLTSFDVRDFTPRPEFVVELKKSFPKGNSVHNNNIEEGTTVGGDARKYDFELNIPFWQKKLPYLMFSYSSVLLLVILALSALSGVIMYRLWFTYFLSKGRASDNDIAWERMTVSFTAASINLMFIVVFGKVYERIALKLTELEIPRTQSEFDASYTLKIYLLQFVNNYSSIFYVAFFKGAYAGHPHKYHKLFGILRQEECGISCMPELCIQLVVIMVGKQAKSMFMEAFLPWCKRGIRRATARLKVATVVEAESLGSVDPPSRKTSLTSCQNCQWTQDYDLLDWGQYLLTDEYLEMVLQFGFVTIFVTAFPLAPLFALINNLLELRVDGAKMLRHYRRPIGIRVKDIGVWSRIVDGIVRIAVLSNACILALTSNFIPKFMYRYVLQDHTSLNYGTLNGYLNNTLTVYDTSDLESKPNRTVLLSDASASVCQNDYTADKKYEYRIDHWQIWLARVIFIIIYENIVALLILLLRWLIPDIPSELRRQMQYEQRLVNDLILKHELRRAQKTSSAHTHTIYNIRQMQQESVFSRNVRKSASGSAQSKS